MAKKPRKPRQSSVKGRPASYKPEMCETVKNLCRIGATMGDIATFLNVSERSVYLWRAEHPEFDDAFFAGLKDPNARVEVSLYKQAIGYFMDEEEIKVIEGQVVRVPIRKWYPPSASAAIYWSKVKMGWRDDAPEDEAKTINGTSEEVLESPRQIARRVLFLIHKAEKDSAA